MQQFLGNAKSLADVKLKSGQPLDYSFKWLTSLTGERRHPVRARIESAVRWGRGGNG